VIEQNAREVAAMKSPVEVERRDLARRGGDAAGHGGHGEQQSLEAIHGAGPFRQAQA